MSDQNREAELKEQIALLSNALQREKSANKKLQAKIEENAQEHYENNKSFLGALEQANSRQIQLQFLANLNNDMFIVRRIDDMVEQFLSNVASMFDHCTAFDIRIDKKSANSIARLDPLSQKLELMPWAEKYDEGINQLLFLTNASENWKRIEFSDVIKLPSLEPLLEHNTILVSVIELSDQRTHMLLLDIGHFCYGDEFKQTLNTASQQFSMIIKRRLTEVELSYNYQKLKSTIKELKSTQNQLLHSEKMASLGQLAAGIAHEINNPLSFIASNLETLNEYCQIFEKALNSAKEITLDSGDQRELDYARADVDELTSSCIKGVERISEIVVSLKAFSRKDIDNMDSININHVINSALKIVWNQLKYNYQVTQELSEDIPQCLGNSGQLQQVFINLFVNAAHAMKDTGELTITSNYIDDYIEVCVTDTGCGMDQDAIKHLFEPFYTTKQENEGTGLGLSVSYAILEKHNALISVNSEKNKGSTFTLRFPGYYPE